MDSNSKIIQLTNTVTRPGMEYEAIAHLYTHSDPQVFGETVAFVLSCSRNYPCPKGSNDCIQKLEISASPSFSNARMEITHEVVPGLGASGDIVNVNDKLLVAGFDAATIVPIKNFGHKKTFNCDVRGGLKYHETGVVSLAANSKGTHLASGSSRGAIALYQAREEEITFVSRSSKVCTSMITGLAYFQPVHGISVFPSDGDAFSDENVIIYTTSDGHIGLIDARCDLGDQVKRKHLYTTEPRENISSLCVSKTKSHNQIYFGTRLGVFYSMDLRSPGEAIFNQHLEGDSCIRRIKEIVVKDERGKDHVYIGYTNHTDRIQFLDPIHMTQAEGWICERLPEGRINDMKQVGNRVFTCGFERTIGCWTWHDPKIDEMET